MGTIRTRKSDSGYFESYANRGSLLTGSFSSRNLPGDANEFYFGVLSGLPVDGLAAFTGTKGGQNAAWHPDHLSTSALSPPPHQGKLSRSQFQATGWLTDMFCEQ